MMFKDLIGISMEVYVDDMLVKSKMVGDQQNICNRSSTFYRSTK